MHFLGIKWVCICKFAPSRWKCPNSKQQAQICPLENSLGISPMHQNLAVILRQFNYGKNSFTVLIPGPLRHPKGIADFRTRPRFSRCTRRTLNRTASSSATCFTASDGAMLQNCFSRSKWAQALVLDLMGDLRDPNSRRNIILQQQCKQLRHGPLYNKEMSIRDSVTR